MSTTGNGRPFAVRADTGDVLWMNERVSVESSPVYANGKLYVHGQNFDGKGGIDNNVGLFSLDATTGTFEWLDNYFRYSYALAPTVVADNGIFVPGMTQ